MSSYHNGLAAEDAIERWYMDHGATPVARRWRCETGEIDLIVEKAGTLIFVEVKIRKSIDAAAHAISHRQWSRIMATAEAYLAQNGQSLETDVRFDAALMDRHGHVSVIENAAPI